MNYDWYYNHSTHGLCFTFKGLTECGMSYKTLESASGRTNTKPEGSGSIPVISHPEHGKLKLVIWDKLHNRHKQKVNHALRIINKCKHEDKEQCDCGDPLKYVSLEPIKKLLDHKDFKAEAFFISYNFDGKKRLATQVIKKYTREASILNKLASIKNIDIVKELKLPDVPAFYKNVREVLFIERENGKIDDNETEYQISADFPLSYPKLLRQITIYKQQGYPCLIDPAYGNQRAAKITDDVSESQLLALIEDPRQMDDVLVCFFYNKWAAENNYKEIGVATVAGWRQKREDEITIGRKGSSAFNEKFIRQVKGLLPSVPLALVEHDDNNLDFLYKDGDGYEFNKYVSINVIDSRTKLLLGKSYMLGQSPQQWQVQHAYIDAMYYIRSLTGGWYLPFEIKADKWASKSLTPFYNKIAKVVTPAHGNKHRGYIEQFYGSPIWKRAQQLVSQDNWSGNNITAKNRGVNVDNLNVNGKSRPMIGEAAEMQIEKFYHLLRRMPDITREDMKAQSKEEKFLEEWAKMSDADKRPISDEQFFLIFGIRHQPKHTTGIRITNRGIEPQIGNFQYSYDLPESWMYNQLRGKQVEVLYDPYDMSRIMVTNNQDIRFIAKTAELSPRALKDTYTGSRQFLNTILADKKQQVKEVTDKSAKRKAIVDTSHYNAEAMVQGGVIIKELKNTAEQKVLEDFNRDRADFIGDFDDFFN